MGRVEPSCSPSPRDRIPISPALESFPLDETLASVVVSTTAGESFKEFKQVQFSAASIPPSIPEALHLGDDASRLSLALAFSATGRRAAKPQLLREPDSRGASLKVPLSRRFFGLKRLRLSPRRPGQIAGRALLISRPPLRQLPHRSLLHVVPLAPSAGFRRPTDRDRDTGPRTGPSAPSAGHDASSVHGRTKAGK